MKHLRLAGLLVATFVISVVVTTMVGKDKINTRNSTVVCQAIRVQLAVESHYQKFGRDPETIEQIKEQLNRPIINPFTITSGLLINEGKWDKSINEGMVFYTQSFDGYTIHAYGKDSFDLLILHNNVPRQQRR